MQTLGSMGGYKNFIEKSISNISKSVYYFVFTMHLQQDSNPCSVQTSMTKPPARNPTI